MTREQLLNAFYPFNTYPDPEGGFVIVFPDLPGCVTQCEHASEVNAIADDARRAWIESEWEDGMVIPLPFSSIGAEYD